MGYTWQDTSKDQYGNQYTGFEWYGLGAYGTAPP